MNDLNRGVPDVPVISGEPVSLRTHLLDFTTDERTDILRSLLLWEHVPSGETDEDSHPWKSRCKCGAWFYLLENHHDAIMSAYLSGGPVASIIFSAALEQTEGEV